MFNNSVGNKFKKVITKDYCIILLFAVFSVISAIFLLRANFVGNAWDLYFHWSRIYELKSSINDGDFVPKILLNCFGEIGTAAMTMYPKMNLYPIVFFSYFIKSPVSLIYIIFMMRNFIALIIAYYSCFYFTKSKNKSFLFSVCYVISNIVLYYEFNSMDIGVTSSLIFLPLVLFGTLSLINDYRWKELTIGMSAIVLCHVLTTLLAVIMVLSLVLANIDCIKNKNFWISSFKAMVFSTLLTSIFWIPFIFITINNSLRMPSEIILSGTDFNTLISSIMNNEVNHYINIVAFLGIVLSVINYKHMSMNSKKLFWVSALFLFIASPFFPWILLNSTSLKSTFQYSWRVYNIPQIILTYLFSDNIVDLCKKKKESYLLTVFVTILVVTFQIVGQKKVINEGQKNPYNFNDIKQSTIITDDYAPNEYLPVRDDISMHLGSYNDNNKLKVKLLGDGRFGFHIGKHAREVALPFFIYKGINYSVKLDNKQYPFESNKYSELMIKNVSEGNHKIKISVNKSWYDYLSYILSLFGLVGLITILFRDRKGY